MSNEDPLKNWQLENRSEEPAQWKLQASEQDLNRHLQLQPTDLPGPEWQPVEYQRVQRPRRNWVLPSIVIVALLGVLAYVGWVGFSRFGGGGFSWGSVTAALPGFGQPAAGAATATPSPAALAAVAASPTPLPPTPTTAPTATIPPEPTATVPPEPAPTLAMADWVTGVVNAVDGVNARGEPATTGALVRLLNQGEKVTVVSEQAGWLQVILPDNTVAWIAAEFLDRTAQTVPLEQINALLAAANLPPIGGSAPLTSTLLAAAVAAAAAEPTPAAVVTFDVTVLGDPGINARSLPSTEGVILAAVPLSSTLTALGKSADGLWLAVQLADGQVSWVLAQFVAPSGDVAALTVIDPAALAATSAVTDTVTPAAPTPSASAPAEPAPAAGAVTLAGAVSRAGLGANLRAAPDSNLNPIVTASAGAAIIAVGRTADAAWLQVQLADGTVGWVLAGTVAMEGDVTTLPIQQ